MQLVVAPNFLWQNYKKIFKPPRPEAPFGADFYNLSTFCLFVHSMSFLYMSHNLFETYSKVLPARFLPLLFPDEMEKKKSAEPSLRITRRV